MSETHDQALLRRPYRCTMCEHVMLSEEVAMWGACPHCGYLNTVVRDFDPGVVVLVYEEATDE